LGSVDEPLARPLLHLHATSVACPEARPLRRKTKPTPLSARSSSLQTATLQHVKTEEPFFSSGLDRTFGRPCQAFRKCRPQGLATLPAVSALLPSEASFSSPRSWASLFRALFRPPGPFTVSRERSAPAFFCQTFRPGIDASAAYAREASCASSSPAMVITGAEPPLLSFCVSRVSFRRTLEEAPSFFLPLPTFAFRPPKMPETGTPGVSFRRRSLSPLSRGADPHDVSDRLHLPPLRNVDRPRPIFSARGSLNPHGP